MVLAYHQHRVMIRRFQDQDFYEGARAAMIDKDKKPSLKPATIEEIDQDMVEIYFSKLEEKEELVL